jgi:hypothetical protein
MRIRIRTHENDYFLKLLSIISNIPPFNKLRPKELELYAHLLTVNHKYHNIPLRERNTLIFNYDTKVEIAGKMGIKLSGVYNILSTLRSVKIIENESLIPKYTLTKVKELQFIFEDEEN